ncbi:hypothetical protein HK102_000468 [Quaeritorhiza haematococci]|nr:hypothetical protein HK102_000468 [Quaeritorhiza haematococci]
MPTRAKIILMMVLVVLVQHPIESLAGGVIPEYLMISEAERSAHQGPTGDRLEGVTWDENERAHLFIIAASIGMDIAHMVFNSTLVLDRADMSSFVADVFHLFMAPLGATGTSEIPLPFIEALENMRFPHRDRLQPGETDINMPLTESLMGQRERLGVLGFRALIIMVQRWILVSPEMDNILMTIRDGALSIWRTVSAAGKGGLGWRFIYDLRDLVLEVFNGTWDDLQRRRLEEHEQRE